MKYVVAVSGGVDSVVLLDVLASEGTYDVLVAHFDHGIRSESDADARFVEGLAARYGLPFFSRREELGASVSEEAARTQRYAFLKAIARNADARLVTAHHLDDVVETIAINLERGTGWRGLNVMSDTDVDRPLLGWTKQAIYDYALGHSLEWVEDETNRTNRYLRNRVRTRTMRLDDETKRRLGSLRSAQSALAERIDEEAARFLTGSRYFMTMIDEATALELLRTILAANGLSLTRPRRSRLLHAIKTTMPGAKFEAGENVTVEFTRREFIVKHPL